MTTEEIADRLVTLCRKGNWEDAQRELYADDVVSLEPHDTPLSAKETRGLPAVIEKGKKFNTMIEETHRLTVSDPVTAENAFACAMTLDITMKGQGRMNMSEICIYEVKDGKIVKEQFFA